MTEASVHRRLPRNTASSNQSGKQPSSRTKAQRGIIIKFRLYKIKHVHNLRTILHHIQ